MQVKDAMTADVRLIDPDHTLAEAARAMSEIDAGILPVREEDRLVGIITDRDIAVRGIAAGMGPDAKVREVMSHDVKFCYEDDDVEDVSRNMANIQLRRLPVLTRDRRLVGILSIGDIATHAKNECAGDALEGVARKSSQHNQSLAADWEHRGGAYDAV